MKTWLITGTSTGFGRELVKAVLADGDRVVATARNIDHVKDLVSAGGDRAVPVQLDLTRPDQIARAVDAAERAFDDAGIDVLVNNAGIGYFSAVEEATEEAIRQIFEINVFGLSDLTRKVLPGMRARRSGAIVNFSSIGGLRSFPAVGYYSATKFAVEGLTEALHHEIAPLGLKTMLVEPGPFRTDWAGRSAAETLPEREIADYADTAGAQRAAFRQETGKEPGDPRKAAVAIVTALKAPSPPRRLLLGTPALELALDHLKSLETEFRRWEELTTSADF
ncbi:MULTISPECIES: oxidoreductase [Arthrobacter]|uniref:oxidoreductase n=1 Tax=Arthrobacter TaxID=1663 RepID=UPI001BFD4C84|nr:MULTISPECIES: oxidoreductase [Arthrobacter]MBT8163466.1 SDR family NAD(P)-dependent oxidoreductase [Arthrobacter sp. GN70]